jgi:hypothetical protein
MCLACVSRPAASTAQHAAAQLELMAWTDSDQQRAQIVYRQLPRWSRLLFDALSASSAREHCQAELRSVITCDVGPFDVEDACRWAAEYCAAVGRSSPVMCAAGTDGEHVYRMQEDAARLFRELARGPG